MDKNDYENLSETTVQGCMLRVGQHTAAILLFTRSCTASCKVRLARRKLLIEPAASPKARQTECPLE